ncbi:hypothetical protein HNP40_001621 [Mycobacteroides chelonae]|nr:hypothetical protein [Mycobacteroides chelonae]
MTHHRDSIPSVAEEIDAERKKNVAAMHRLLITEKPRVVTVTDRLVIDTLRREATVTRPALTHRHVDLKEKYQDLQKRATHGEGAIISKDALKNLESPPSPCKVSSLGNRRRK